MKVDDITPATLERTIGFEMTGKNDGKMNLRRIWWGRFEGFCPRFRGSWESFSDLLSWPVLMVVPRCPCNKNDVDQKCAKKNQTNEHHSVSCNILKHHSTSLSYPASSYVSPRHTIKGCRHISQFFPTCQWPFSLHLGAPGQDQGGHQNLRHAGGATAKRARLRRRRSKKDADLESYPLVN